MALAMLYPLDKSDYIVFSAVPEESLSLSASISDLPTEAGVDITDHIQTNPEVFNLTGVITDGTNGKTAEEQKKLLQRLNRDSRVLRYVGRNIVTFVAIESASINTSAEIGNGYFVSLSLREIRTVAIEEEILPGPDPTISDVTRIMRIIVGLEPAVPGVDYSVSDVTATLRQIVGMQAETRQERDGGYVEPDRIRGERYVPIKKEATPYRARVNIDGFQYDFVFRYDRIDDRFYCDVSVVDVLGRNRINLAGRKLIYGQQLHPHRRVINYQTHAVIPYPKLRPYDLSGRESVVNYDTLGDSVYLFIE